MPSDRHPHAKRVERTRTRRDGAAWSRTYWYYRREGAPDDGARLPDDPASPEFRAALERFDARADGERGPEAGTVARLISDYRASPDFTDLAPKTCRDYSRILNRLGDMLGDFRPRSIERKHVNAIRDELRETRYMANYTVRVLRRLLAWGHENGYSLRENPATRPKYLKTTPRRQVWSPAAEARFLDVASPEMALAYVLHAYTAQRQGDILAMTWHQYSGGRIRLRQAKTDALVEVPVHRELGQVLAATPKVSMHILTDARGRPWKADNFRHHWRAATLAAGLDGLQNRDLRRTAMVRMAEAGATDIEIAAVSGHTIEETRKILETYIPRNATMAEAAVRKLEAAGTRPKPKH